jgi:hypothetical protein
VPGGVCVPSVVSFADRGPSFDSVSSGVCVPSLDCVPSRVSFDDRGLNGVCVPSAADAADEETTKPRVSLYVDDLQSNQRSFCLPSGVCEPLAVAEVVVDAGRGSSSAAADDRRPSVAVVAVDVDEARFAAARDEPSPFPIAEQSAVDGEGASL